MSKAVEEVIARILQEEGIEKYQAKYLAERLALRLWEEGYTIIDD